MNQAQINAMPVVSKNTVTVSQALDPKTNQAVPGAASVSWLSVTSKSRKMTYTVYYQKASTIPPPVMYTKCGLQAGALLLLNPIVTTGSLTATTMTYQTSAGALDPNILYIFNVVAQDENGTYVAYRMTSPISLVNGGTDGGASSTTMKYVLGIGIPVVVLMALGCGYLFWQNRQLSKELDVEMHDVPKAAVIKALHGPGKRAAADKNYSSLLQEGMGDDDEDEEDYLPPTMAQGGVSINSSSSQPAWMSPSASMSYGGAHVDESDSASMMSNRV